MQIECFIKSGKLEMDRNYYYRILGLNENATSKQIKQAYEERIAKLSSADYRDDPFYAEKKKRQATEAYRVLTGSAPPVSNAQRRARFEKLKDRIEQKESGGRPQESDSQDTYKEARPDYKNEYRKNSSGSKKKFVVPIIIVVAVTLITVLGSVFFAVRDYVGEIDFSNFNDILGNDSNDYTDIYSSIEDVSEKEQIEAAYETGLSLDYYSNLDTSAIAGNEENVQWTYGQGEYGGSEDGSDDVFNSTFDVLYALEIYDMAGFYYYATGDQEFFFNYDDYQCAATLIEYLSAPPFEEIAGSTNLYTGEPILNIADYLGYIWYVINEQV